MDVYFWNVFQCYFSVKYVDMRDNYVGMQDSYVNMHNNYADMQEKCNVIFPAKEQYRSYRERVYWQMYNRFNSEVWHKTRHHWKYTKQATNQQVADNVMSSGLARFFMQYWNTAVLRIKIKNQAFLTE